MLYRFVILLTSLLLIFSQSVFAEGNVAVNVSGVLSDSNWGVIGDWEKGIFEVEGNLQGGKSYAGNVDASVTLFDLLKLSSKNTLKGGSLDTLGRENDLSAGLVFGLTDEIDIIIGIAGRNGNPFKPVYELENPSDPTSVILKDVGITVKDGSSLLGSLETELEVGGWLKVELQGLLELLGEGEKVQQLRANLSTGGAIRDSGFTWHAGANVRIQKYAGLIEYGTDYFAGFGKRFR